MTDIPERVTIPLGKLQRSALRSLMDHAPPGYRFEELLELVLMKGLAALVKGRSIDAAHQEIVRQAEADLPSGTDGPSDGQRVSVDYLGFFIEADDDRALEALVAQHAFVDEDELCRIIFSAGLRAIQHDDVAQQCLTAAVWTNADGSIR
jgi:hypothetical protein